MTLRTGVPYKNRRTRHPPHLGSTFRCLCTSQTPTDTGKNNFFFFFRPVKESTQILRTGEVVGDLRSLVYINSPTLATSTLHRGRLVPVPERGCGPWGFCRRPPVRVASEWAGPALRGKGENFPQTLDVSGDGLGCLSRKTVPFRVRPEYV